MRELYYENQGTNTYLVYEIKDTDVVDSMSLGMLTNNRINGLAQTIFTQMDNSKYIKFNVSAKVSVAQFFMGAVNKKRLLGVFKGISDAILAAEDYMLDVNNMLLDLDYIFTDVSSCETVLICLPVMDEDCAIVDMRSFFRNIMFSTQFDQTENCDYVARLINYLNSTPIFSMADFRELVVSLLNGESAQVIPQQASQPTPQVVPKPTPQPVPQPIPQPAPQPVPQPIPQPIPQPVPQPIPQPKVEIPVPKQPTSQVPQPEVSTSQDIAGSETQMTMMGLLRNFSKENMALYKAQKEAQKAAPKQEKAKDKKEKKEKVKATPSPSAGFAIPGQAPSVPTPSEAPKQSVVAPQQPKATAVSGATMTPTQAALFNTPSAVKTPVQPVAPQPIPQPVPQPVAPSPAMTPTQMAFGGAGFGETTVLGSPTIGETTVLSQAQNPMQPVTPYLLRNKNSEKIMLTKPSFRIGKERSFVDYFIADNTAISRCHAQIVNRDGEYFVIDMNSTNHTFVNAMMINSNEEVKLSDGDKVRLANEDFEFHLR